MTSLSQQVISKNHYDVDISLGDDSKVDADQRGTRKVKWQTKERACTISLLEALVSQNIAMSMLSVPALVKKEIAVFLLLGKALFIDLSDGMKIRGTAA